MQSIGGCISECSTSSSVSAHPTRMLRLGAKMRAVPLSWNRTNALISQAADLDSTARILAPRYSAKRLFVEAASEVETPPPFLSYLGAGAILARLRPVFDHRQLLQLELNDLHIRRAARSSPAAPGSGLTLMQTFRSDNNVVLGG